MMCNLKSCCLALFLLLTTWCGASLPAWVSAEYLYLLPCQAGMSYAIITDSASPSDNPQNLEQTFAWESGVRVSCGCALPCFGLDLVGRWMQLDADHRVSKDGSFVIVVSGALGAPMFAGTETVASGVPESQWKMDLDMFDLNIAYTLLQTCCWQGDVYWGAKGGWIKQSQFMCYRDFSFSPVASTPVSETKLETNNFYGAGPQVGMALNYQLGCNIAARVAAEGAILFGRLISPTTYVTEFSGTTTTIRTHAAGCQAIPAIRVQMGLDWETCLFSCCPLFLGVGYELQHFTNTFLNSNTLTVFSFVPTVGYADLLLHGLTVSAGICF